MKLKTTMLLLPLLISTAFATAAEANHFTNPYANIRLNPGSAPNPTPEDQRTRRVSQLPGYENAKNREQTAQNDRTNNEPSRAEAVASASRTR